MSDGEGLLTLVVDNSIAVKWYAPQDYSEEALRVFNAGQVGEARLVAPALIHAEFGNALWRYYQAGEYSLEEIRELWDDFERVPLDLFDIAPVIPRALAIATSCGCTVYDALYIALAWVRREEGRERAVAVTADVPLLRSLKGTTYEDLGVHIADVGELLPVS